MNDIDWARPKRPTPRPARQSCAVCGLRADCLVCRECADRPEASIAWLERLPQDERTKTALAVLRRVG